MTGRKAIVILLPAVLIILFTISSCSFKSKDEYFCDVTRGKPPVISFPDAIGTDTIVASQYIAVDVECDDMPYRQVDILIGGKLKYSAKGRYVRFHVPATALGIEQGIYKAVVNAYSYPGSGSLAGIMGRERLMATRNIILVYFHDPVPFTPDLTFSNTQGTLLCTLTVPQSGEPVTKILVEKSVGSVQQFYPLYSITGSSPFIFSDSTYVGELADFRITTYFANQDKTYFFPLSIGVAQKNREPETVSYSIDGNGHPVIQWQITAYPANCSGYRIFNVFPGVKKEVATIHDVGQTTYTLTDVAFPGENKVYVSPVPKGPPPYYNEDLAIKEYSGLDHVVAGAPSFKYTYFYSPAGDDFFTVDNDTITGYSVTTLAVTHQIISPRGFYATNISPNNKYLLSYIFDNSGFKYIFYDITTKTLTYVPANLVGDDLIVELAISDNGIGVIGSYFGDVTVYDFINNRILSIFRYFYYPRSVVSPDGHYFFIQDAQLHLYQNDNGTITEIWHSQTFEDPYIYYSFLPWDGSKAMVIKNKVCSVQNCSDWSLVRSFPVDFDYVANTDFNRGTIMGKNDQIFRIVDFNSGSVLKTFYTNSQDYRLNYSGINLFYAPGKRIVISNKNLP